MLDHRALKPLPHLILIELALIEIFLHQRFVISGDRFDEFPVKPVCFLALRIGDGELRGPAAFGREPVLEHLKDIDYSIEPRSLVERVLHDDHILSHMFPRLRHGAVKVRLILIELVHGQQHGRPKSLGIFPDDVCTDLHSEIGVEQHTRECRGC